MLQRVERLSDLFGRYDVVLCDVWGVLHNGVTAWPLAVEALHEARSAGKTVVLITNSPRPAAGVIPQLEMLGADRGAYDAIVTSGDVTRTLIADCPREIFFLGPDRDLELLSGLDVERVSADEARAVVCTGLFDDESETPDDYADLLAGFNARDLPFICANPDIVVERGDRLIYCAGALAAAYAELGGKTRIAGKPHFPIYQAALAAAAGDGAAIAMEKVVAVGDGLATDVKGAADFGLDVLYIATGIHAQDYLDAGRIDERRMAEFLTEKGAAPQFWMPRLT